MIENNTFNKVELLRAHMLIHSVLLGALFCTLPIQENNDIKNVEIKNYIFYFNSDYIENENFENIVVNISINLIQFYFECNNYDINLMFTIKAFLSRYRWYRYDKYQNFFDDNMNILADKLKKINIQKSSIIYYSNRNQQFRTYNHIKFDNVIQHLPHDSNFIQHDINNDVDINSVVERCQFIFQILFFDSISEMNIFFINIFIIFHNLFYSYI